MILDAYLITIWYKNADGSKTQTHWTEHGRKGFTEAIETIAWDFNNHGAISATIDRYLPHGGTVEVYARRAN